MIGAELWPGAARHHEPGLAAQRAGHGGRGGGRGDHQIAGIGQSGGAVEIVLEIEIVEIVNGDAELIFAMDNRGGQCQVLEQGSLQEVKLRDEVCRVMEGGKEAFALRYRRIGEGGSRV